ncbi:hypothetical protein D9M69_559970 [compost metagenome]
MDEAHVHLQPARVDQAGDEQAEGDHDQAAHQVGFLAISEQESADGGGAGPQRDEDRGEAEHEAQAHGEHGQPFAPACQHLQFVHRPTGDIGQVARHQRQHAGGQEGDHACREGAENTDATQAHGRLLSPARRNHFLQVRDDFRAVPGGLAELAPQLTTLAVQQQGGRQAERAEARNSAGTFVDIDA